MYIGITGYSGFVGNEVTRLMQEGHSVYTIGRANTRENHIPFTLGEGFSDYSVPDLDCIIHIASHIPHFQTDPDILTCEVPNGGGMLKLLEGINKEKLVKFINISSAHIFDNHLSGLISNPYEGSKLSAEIFLKAYACRYGFGFCNLRLAYVYGPGMKHGKMFRIFIEKALKNEPIILNNEGKNKIHLAHVYDVARIVHKCLMNISVTGTYDVCNPQAVTTLDIAQTIIRLTRSKSRIILQKDAKEPEYYHLNPEKIIKESGIGSFLQVEEGIITMLKEEYQICI